MRELQKVYTLFEDFIAHYIQQVEGAKKKLYREEKGNDVLYTNLKKFFAEKNYSATSFQRYAPLLQKDMDYLGELFPTIEKGDTILTKTSYDGLVVLEKRHKLYQQVLDISTLSVWRILMR